MTDDEAVSKFIRHLKSKDARVHIRNLYRGDRCPTMDEAIQAAYVFESARNEHGTYSFLPNQMTPSTSRPIDDPMDLSALREVINYISTNNNLNSRGGHRGVYRGGYRGGQRGGFRGGFRGRGFSRGDFQGGFRGNLRGRGSSRGQFRGAYNGYQQYQEQETRSCYQCHQVGHLQYNCPQNRQDAHYINDGFYYNEEYNYDDEQQHYCCDRAYIQI
ncbi:hypothetical protein INT47_006978 [Mucor saturninus]|uniref:CCHC-type domain-containing protein n=1 Tax=Mucor saturninus TaxID=64648 RepID=A0A8H7QGQ8_9FUNG|nr:hypothetical protein INT47_006978 [Mucor saturninus]